MSDQHPNVKTVQAMTTAIFDQDHDALARIFTDDLVFHLRGPVPSAGDHPGVGGLLEVIGTLFEATGGQIDLDQQFCIGARTAGRPSGSTPPSAATARPSSPSNAFVYRFEGGRIAEMWMFIGVLPERAEAFFA